MPGSVTSVFSEPEDFEASLREDGCLSLLIAGRGEFRARLVQLTLHRLRLSAVEERPARLAFITVPAGMLLILFAIRGGTAPVYGGLEARAGEIVAVGSGQRTHARTGALAHWAAICLPVADLARYATAITGAPFAVPVGIQCWAPMAADSRRLRQFHAAAIHMAEARPRTLL